LHKRITIGPVRGIGSHICRKLSPTNSPAAPAQAPQLDQKSQDILSAFDKFYNGLQSFQVDIHSGITTETPLAQPVGTTNAATPFRPPSLGPTVSVTVIRPDHLAVVQKEGNPVGFLLFDGKTYTVYFANRKAYLSVPAIDLLFPDTAISQNGAPFLYTIGMLRDFLSPDPSKRLLRGVTTGTYLGNEPIDGKPADHLALQTHTNTLDLWIASEKAPLLLQVEITRNPNPIPPSAASAPTPATPPPARTISQVTYKNWATGDAVTTDVFNLKPPADAKEMPNLPGRMPMMPFGPSGMPSMPFHPPASVPAAPSTSPSSPVPPPSVSK